MSGERKNIKKETRQLNLKHIEKIHPHKMLLYLFIFGSSLVFLFMILAYALNVNQINSYGNFPFPKAFIISTFIMMLSSHIITRLIPAFKKEQIHKLKNYLAATIFLGIAFSISQYVGWMELMEANIFLTGEAAGTYLYVITGLHLFHFAGGMFFMVYLFFQSLKMAKDPVKVLISVTNPYERIRLEIIETYWHFLGILWLVLFFYFLFTL